MKTRLIFHGVKTKVLNIVIFPEVNLCLPPDRNTDVMFGT